jgi:hypothetical protein
MISTIPKSKLDSGRVGVDGHPLRMFTALATTKPIVTSAVSAWTAMSDFAVAVSGIVSVGLNAVAFVNDVYR